MGLAQRQILWKKRNGIDIKNENETIKNKNKYLRKVLNTVKKERKSDNSNHNF